MARYRIHHSSRYRYDAPASDSAMLLCLEPGTDGGQRLLDFALTTRPAARLSRTRDAFGNARHLLTLHRSHRALAITARASVAIDPPAALPQALAGDAWDALRAATSPFADWDFIRPSALIAPPAPLLAAFAARHGIAPGACPLAGLRQLNDALYRGLRYAPGSTSAASPVDRVLESGSGVCQDYAHAMIAIARSWGIPARYVSGYLHLAGLAREQAAANASHAWVECRLPTLGWVGFDPTNGSLADERHIRIAHGRDYGDVSPTRGVRQGGGEERLQVEVEVRPA